MSLPEDLLKLPKAELHVHLEGAIQPETLLELARRNDVKLPADNIADLRHWFEFRDFHHFVEVYIGITRCLRTRADYELITVEYAREARRQNIRHAEITFTPGTHRMLGVPEDDFLSGLESGRRRAREEFGVSILWIFDIVRNAEHWRDAADYTLRVALEAQSLGVVALGLGGMELGHPPAPFAPWFERALSEGLHSIPHAGEGLGPESVRDAIDLLGAERIGHGVRAVEDLSLVELLVERRIPLEVCPTSNIRLGYYGSYNQHPLRRLHEAGVIVTVNTDDPPLFNTTMNQEVDLMRNEFEFKDEAARTTLRNGFVCSLLPNAEKEALLKDFDNA